MYIELRKKWESDETTQTKDGCLFKNKLKRIIRMNQTFNNNSIAVVNANEPSVTY
jgi:hypothetical protein